MSQAEGASPPLSPTVPATPADARQRDGKAAIGVPDPQAPRTEGALELLEIHLPRAVAQMVVDYMDELPRNWAVWALNKLEIPSAHLAAHERLTHLLFLGGDDAVMRYAGHFVTGLMELEACPVVAKLKECLAWLCPPLLQAWEARQTQGADAADEQAIADLQHPDAAYDGLVTWTTSRANVAPVGADIALRILCLNRDLHPIEVEFPRPHRGSQAIPLVTCEARGKSHDSKAGDLIPGLERFCVNPESPRSDRDFDWYRYCVPARLIDMAGHVLRSAVRSGNLDTLAEHFRELSEARDLDPQVLSKYVSLSGMELFLVPPEIIGALADGIRSLPGLSLEKRNELVRALPRAG
jgi:hypothetical protein